METNPATTTEYRASEQYLTFRIDTETFGIEVLKVQEIIGYREVTPIPNAPNYLRGVLNLRGIIVPVVELRKQFGFTEKSEIKESVIVIVHAVGKVMGMIVDSVTDVLAFHPGSIQPPPDLTLRINTEFISGMVSLDGEMITLLDIDQVFTDEQFGILDQASKNSKRSI